MSDCRVIGITIIFPGEFVANSENKRQLPQFVIYWQSVSYNGSSSVPEKGGESGGG